MLMSSREGLSKNECPIGNMNVGRRADKLLVSVQGVCGKCAVAMLFDIVVTTGRVSFVLVCYVES